MQLEMRLDGKICYDFYIFLEFGKNNLVLRFLVVNIQREIGLVIYFMVYKVKSYVFQYFGFVIQNGEVFLL